MSGADELTGLLAGLGDTNPRARDLAAAELGDLLEAGSLDRETFRRVLAELTRAALSEPDEEAKESMFNALSSMATAPRQWPVDWGPIAAHLDELSPDCLEHALVILGFSQEPRYRARIEPFLRHPDKTVRAEAREAMRMLGGKEGQRTARASQG